MRKVIDTEFISLDGVTQSPNLFQFDNYDEEIQAHMRASLTLASDNQFTEPHRRD